MFIAKVGDNQYVPNTEYQNNRIYVENVFDSLDVNQNFVFDRTIQIRESNTYMEGMQPTNHFFSEGVGLVKKELLDSNQVRNLVDYHIEQ